MCSSEAVSATIKCDMCVSPEDEEEVETREVRRVGMQQQTTGGVGFLLPRSEREVSRASEAAVAKYCDGEWQMTKIRDGGRAAAVEGGPGRSSD